jgi:hypothetical protein
VAGCGMEGTSDGPAVESSFTQLRDIWGEGKVLYVTDVGTGSVRMITPLSGTVSFLAHLAQLYDSFGVHMKGQKPAKCSVGDAIPVLEKAAKFLNECSDNVQMVVGKKMVTNGPQGTVSNKTQVSTSMVASGLRRLQGIILDVNANYEASLELQSCLTCIVENLHAVTKMKHPTPPMLDHAREFGNSMRESLKRIAVWSVKYFTHPHSYYPVPEVGMKLANLSSTPSMAPLPGLWPVWVHQMSPS